MKKHPMSPNALGLAVKSIIKCVEHGHASEEVIEAMIEGGWRTCKPEWMANRNVGSAISTDTRDYDNKNYHTDMAAKFGKQSA